MNIVLKNITAEMTIEDNLSVYGWGTVCKEWCPEEFMFKNYEDPEGDIINEYGMVKATTEFMKSDRIVYDTHKLKGDLSVIGQVIHSMPITEDMIKARIFPNMMKTGWWVGAQMRKDIFKRYLLPADNPEAYRSFSIGFVPKTVREV